ncbi:MAG: rhodanese-related sulfurtransferase [Bacteroidales bacterium]|nr:rhodanese-related sulfurtransferase [Bacteroidales bacterium]
MFLHNRVDKRILKQRLMEEDVKRTTISFYRYVRIKRPQEFRDILYYEWTKLNCFGRIYIAREGINAQMSVPEHHMDAFLEKLQTHPELKNIPINYAVEDDGKSFYKLTMKVRGKIVADGHNDGDYDVTNVGNRLDALKFHELSQKDETIVVDMRNHYESEIGYFKGALTPDSDTFREEIETVVDQLHDKKDQKILLYCTGGIRCEKASAYLRHHGFNDVNQLQGGVIEYTRKIKQLNLKPNFIGKNFVFDERLSERITDDVVARCHQCGNPADNHTNCANEACHQLFIQCDECAKHYEGCCSEECLKVIHLPEGEQLKIRKEKTDQFSKSKNCKRKFRASTKTGLSKEEKLVVDS